MRNRLLVFGILFLGFSAVVLVSRPWWIPWLLNFADTSKDRIQTLSSLASAVFGFVGLVLTIWGLLLARPSSLGPQEAGSQTSIEAGGDRAIAISGDPRLAVLSGDNNVVFSPSASAGLVAGSQVGRDINVHVNSSGPLPSAHDVAVPHQLPPVPADFTGRETELDELLAGIRLGGATICGLRGMGGIGKTTLALKLAHQLREEFPDGQIYLDLKGVDPRPLGAAEAQAHVARSFQPEASLPDNADAIAGSYYTALASRRALLLMDNARDDVQVKPLVPPAGSVLIVTSRQRFTLPGLLRLDLDSLPEADACELLLKITPRIESYALEISKLCGCLPIALRLAAGALDQRVNLSPADYVRRLTDAQTRLGLVDATLSVSYEMLPPELQDIWRFLTIFPETFEDQAAAAVLGLDLEAIKDALATLIAHSLVEWNPTTERYRLHDLARVFAASKLSVDERDRAAREYALHFKAVLRNAESLYRQGGASVTLGLRLFDLEWPNIWEGAAWAREHVDTDEAAAGLCDEYPDAGRFVLNLRLHPLEQIKWREAALAAARRLKRRSSEGWHLGNLGLAYYSLGEYGRAVVFHEQNLDIARELSDAQGEGAALANLGNAYYSLGDYRRAIELSERALDISRDIGHRQGEANVLGGLGRAYHSLGEYARAIEFHDQHLQVAQEIEDRRGEGVALSNLALAYQSLGRYRESLRYYQQCLAASSELGDFSAVRAVLGNLGVLNQRLGEYQAAIQLHRQVLGIARATGDRHAEAIALGNLGSAHRLLGDYHTAIRFHELALSIDREIGSRLGEAQDLGNLGNVYYSLGEYQRCIEFHKAYLAITIAIGNLEGQATALWALSLTLREIGEHREAVLKAVASLKIFERIQDPRADVVRSRLADWENSGGEAPSETEGE